MPTQRRHTIELIEAQGRKDEFRKLFKELDESGTGQLDFKTIREYLKKHRPNLSDRQAMVLFSRVDTDGSGSIEFEEFCAYVLASELLDAKRNRSKNSGQKQLKPWDGPEQLKVNGSWDRETMLALQEFLAAQDTPTASVVKPSRFVCGSMKASHIVVLQELLQDYHGGGKKGESLPCGVWNPRTTKALNGLLLNEGAPTAQHIGEKFVDAGFNKNTVIALQEFLAMMRKGKGSAISLAR